MDNKLESGNIYKIIIFAFTYGISFYYLKMFSKQNSWLVIIASNLIGLLFIKMILNIKNSFPNESIYKINKKVLGNTMGTIVNYIFAATFIFLITIVTWYLTIFLKSNFFVKTPILIIEFFLLLPLFYIANKKTILIVKTSYIFSTIIMIATIISIIFLSPQLEINNLKPFESVNSYNMIKAIFCFTSTTYLPTYVISIFGNLNKKEILKYNFKALLLMIIITLSTYLVLGNSIVEIVDFPEFFVLRKIGIFANGTRIDSIIIIGWILSIYIFNASSLLYVKNFLKNEINSYNNYYIYGIIVTIFFLVPILFKNITIGKLYILNTFPYILFFLLFIPNLIIFYIIKVRLKISHKY